MQTAKGMIKAASRPVSLSLNSSVSLTGYIMTRLWHGVALLTACNSYLSFAFFDNLVASCQEDLMELSQTSATLMAANLSLCNVTYCIGCLIFGNVNGRIDHRLGLVFCLFMAGVFHVAVPSSRSSLQLFLCSNLESVFSAGIDVAVNAWIVQMEETDVNIWMQVMYFCYSIATAVSPLVAAPFLSTPEHESRIIIPYVATALTSILPICLLLALKFKDWSPSESHERLEDPPVESDKRTNSNKMFNLVTGCVLLSFYCNYEIVSTLYNFEFATSSGVHLSKQETSYLMSVANTVFCVTRFLSIGIASRVTSRNMITTSFCFLGVALLLQVLDGGNSLFVLWAATMLASVAMSNLKPAILSFLGKMDVVSNSDAGWLLFSTRLMSVPETMIVGSFINDHPLIYPLFNLLTFAGSADLDQDLALALLANCAGSGSNGSMKW